MKIESIFLALSEPVRLHIFETLIENQLLINSKDTEKYKGNTVKYLARKFNLSKSTITHHLNKLESAKLVEAQVDGKWTHFKPRMANLDMINEWLDDMSTALKSDFRYLSNISLDEDKLRELISLIENHDFRQVHTTTRAHTRIHYLKEKRQKNYYELIYNPETRVLTIRTSTKVNKAINLEFVKLAEKYAHSL